MSIEELHLEPDVAQKAAALRHACPGVVFTSGRRTIYQQSRAMAANVAAAGRGWIRATYAVSAPREALIDWLHRHPAAHDVDDLTAGFVQVLARFHAHELAHLSQHLSGRAFDVRPHSCPVDAVIALHPRQFLTHEGGLERWHVGF